MAPSYVTSFEESTLGALKAKAESSRPVWERYGTDKEVDVDQDPHHIAVMTHWWLTNRGIHSLLSNVLHEHSDDLSDTLHDMLWTIEVLLERQHQELGDLLMWAGHCFRKEGKDAQGRIMWAPRVGLPHYETVSEKEYQEAYLRRGARYAEPRGETTAEAAGESCESVTTPIVGTEEE